jgi:hypothetical protein
LLGDLPKSSRPLIVGQYDEGASGRPKVRCAICHAKRHYKGFLVELPSVGRALLGRNCGSDHFEFDWAKDVQRFEAEIDRQKELLRVTEAAPLIAQLMDLTPTMTIGAKRIDGFISTLRQRSGPLSQHLVRAVRDHGGGLMVTVRERSREAEEESARRRVPALLEAVEYARDPVERQAAKRQLDSWIKDHGQVHIERLERRGILKGGEVLTPSNLATDVIRATIQLRQARDQMAEEIGDPRSVIGALREVGHAFKRVLDANEHLDTFTSEPNLRTIEQWRRQIPNLDGFVPPAEPWKSTGRDTLDLLWSTVGKA